MKTTTPWALVLLAALSAAPAAAQTTASDQQARTLFEAGQTYYRQGEYELAQQQFERAYALSPRPPLLLNASNAAERAGAVADAIRLLEAYLAAEAQPVDEANLRARLQAMRRRLSDRQPDESTPTESTPSGGGGDDSAIIAGAVGWGVGGAGLLMWGIFGGLTLAEHDSIGAGCGATTSCSESDLSDLRTFGPVADISLIVAVVGAATGTILFFVLDGASGGESAGVRVVPWATSNMAGGSVSGRF